MPSPIRATRHTTGKPDVDAEGRVPLRAPCRLSDGRTGTVIRRTPVRKETILVNRGGRNDFQDVGIYGVTVRTRAGDVVRLPRVRAHPDW